MLRICVCPKKRLVFAIELANTLVADLVAYSDSLKSSAGRDDDNDFPETEVITPGANPSTVNTV